MDIRIREQFLITQQYADKGDAELKRLLEAVAQASGAGAPATGSVAGGVVEAVKREFDAFSSGTVERLGELDTRMQAHFQSVLEEMQTMKGQIQ